MLASRISKKPSNPRKTAGHQQTYCEPLGLHQQCNFTLESSLAKPEPSLSLILQVHLKFYQGWKYIMHSKKLVKREDMTTKIWHLLLFQLGPLGIQYRNYTLEVNQKHPAPPNSQGRPPNVRADKVKKWPTPSVAQWEACRNRWNTREWSSSVGKFLTNFGCGTLRIGWRYDSLFSTRTLIGVPSRVVTTYNTSPILVIQNSRDWFSHFPDRKKNGVPIAERCEKHCGCQTKINSTAVSRPFSSWPEELE